MSIGEAINMPKTIKIKNIGKTNITRNSLSNLKVNINAELLPKVADFEKHFGGGEMNMTGGFPRPGATILNTFDFFANILGMKMPLEKEDQAQLNDLIEQKKEAAQLTADKALGRDSAERLAKMQINAKVASDNATRSQLARQAAAELSENRRYHNNAAPSRIWKILQGIFEPLWRNAAPYIVLFLVLAALVLALKSGGGRRRSNGGQGFNPITALKRSVRNTARTIKRDVIAVDHYIIRKIKKILASIRAFFQKLFHPFYKLKKLSGIVSGGAHNKSFERVKIESGRCDNMNWVETTTEGSKGNCDNAVHPIDLTWKLDTTKTPEYYDLPQNRKGDLDKYLTVKIPWDVNPEATFYVPQCEKAYYPQTCKSNGICEKADMFEDLGLSCKAKDDKLPTQYPAQNDIPAKSFDDADNKKCIDLHTLADIAC